MNTQNINKTSTWLIILFFLTTCNVAEITPRVYPRVKTLTVTNISETGATFRGEVFHAGDQKIIEYGFEWGLFGFAEKKAIVGTISVEKFELDIPTTLVKGES